MADAIKRSATYAELAAVPPHLVAEIVYGTLVTHPRPAPPHAVSSLALGHELTGPFQKGRGGPGGWVFMAEPELHLGPQVIVPDLAAWRRERMPAMPDKAYIETAPDWVCEVLSPTTVAHDKGPKRRIYATYGVHFVWHLDPNARTLEVFELQDGHWILLDVFQDADTVKARPFDAVPFSLADLWPLDPRQPNPA